MTYSEWRAEAASEFNKEKSAARIELIPAHVLITAYGAGLSPSDLCQSYIDQQKHVTKIPAPSGPRIAAVSNILSITYGTFLVLAVIALGIAITVFFYVLITPVFSFVTLRAWDKFLMAFMAFVPFFSYALVAFLIAAAFQWMNQLLLLQWKISEK